MSKTSKIIVLLVIINIFTFEIAYSASYLFEVKNKQSSISTVANTNFNFQSHAQVLMEPITGQILYANNENEHMLPASVTKIMTLLLIMEEIDSGRLNYQDKITCSKNASQMGGSQIWFKEGEQLSVEDAIKAICIVSANDVTVAMAERIGGNEENFVAMMNNRAKELGMENTVFKNCHGIDEEGHYTTAKDIAIMSRELINNHKDILKYTSIWMDTLRNGEFELSSTNKLIRFYDGATGLKTGYTSQALYNLSATATRGDTTLISVVMKAPTSQIRLEETTTLLDYGFSQFEVKKICSSNLLLDKISVNKNIKDVLETRIEKDIYKLCKKGEKIETEQIVKYHDMAATIEKDQTVGVVEVYDKNTKEKIGESQILANNEVLRSNLGEYVVYVLNKFLLKEKS